MYNANQALVAILIKQSSTLWALACDVVYKHATNTDIPEYLNTYTPDTQAAIIGNLPKSVVDTNMRLYVECAMWVWYCDSSKTGFVTPTAPTVPLLKRQYYRPKKITASGFVVRDADIRKPRKYTRK